MFTQPVDLDERSITNSLRNGWDFVATEMSYRPLGFGSHHWLAADACGARRFLTVDDLSAKAGGVEDSADAVFARLARAFQTVRDLNLPFTIAPMSMRNGEVLARIAPGYSLVVHPFVGGDPVGRYGDYELEADQRAVLSMLIELHRATPAARPSALVDDFGIPSRREFEALLSGGGARWQTGPYADRTRSLLSTHRGAVVRLLRVYDDLVADVRRRPERMVITHGEPHPGNVMVTTAEAGGEKRYRLIDWDTNMIAPPERDLWSMAHSDATVLDAYSAATRVTIDEQALTLYRLRWDLAEIALYTTLFAEPHSETEDAAESWTNLNFYLQPATRWPEFIG